MKNNIMKRNILKVFALVLCIAFFLTGCATVTNVTGDDGKNIYFTDVQYSGGQVLTIGDYLYYGNGYISSSSSDFDYSASTKYTGLARLNLTSGLTYDSDVKEVNRANTTPNEIETVNADKVVGFQKQQMFALGDYIYFTSANTHKTSSLENQYEKVSLFRVKFNGDGLSEIVHNSAFNLGTGSLLTLQKGSDGKYYFIIVENGDDSTYTIKTLEVGDKVGSLKTIVENATSYVVADENSTIKSIIYTIDSEKEHTATAVKSIDFATGDIKDLDGGVVGASTTLLGRNADIVFYSYSYKGIEEVYYKNLENGEYYFAPSSNNPKFYSANEISNIMKAGEGYIFISAESKSIMYKTLTGDPVKLMSSSDYSDILFVEDDYLYTSDSTSIKRISVIDKQLEVLVEVDDMVSGQFGYTNEHIYFYAKLGERTFDDDEEDDVNSDVYYMYRTDKKVSNDGIDNLQLVGKTVKIS